MAPLTIESVLSLAAATAAYVCERVKADTEHYAGTELAREFALYVHQAVNSFFTVGAGRRVVTPENDEP